MMCISIVVHQFNRMHPWSTWEGMLPGRCSPGKRCHTFWDVNIVLLRVVSSSWKHAFPGRPGMHTIELVHHNRDAHHRRTKFT